MTDRIIDMIILIMLISVMVHGVWLSLRISKLFAALREMGPMIEAFSSAVDRTEKSVSTLVSTSSRLGEEKAPAERRAPRSDLVQNFYRLVRSKGGAQ